MGSGGAGRGDYLRVLGHVVPEVEIDLRSRVGR
jgi:hypothetical protein